MEFLYILIALGLGCVNVINRALSFQATKHLGTNSGCLMNYLVGTLASLAVLIIYPQSRETMVHLNQAPLWLYLGGVFGVIAFFLNITSLHKMNLFQSAIIILIGQLIASFVLDLIFGYPLSFIKIIGIIIMTIGVIWDRKVSLS